MPKPKQYITPDGRLVFAGQTLGLMYMTLYRKLGKWDSRISHRYKSKRLPPCLTLEQAQEDLDQYAKEQGWRMARDEA